MLTDETSQKPNPLNQEFPESSPIPDIPSASVSPDVENADVKIADLPVESERGENEVEFFTLEAEREGSRNPRSRYRESAPSPDLPPLAARAQSPLPMIPVMSALEGRPSKFSWRQLENVGFTCYVNSTMQALSACRSFFVRARRLIALGGPNLENFQADDDLSLMSSFLNICVKLAKKDIGWSDEAPKRVSFDELIKLRDLIPSLSKNLIAGEQHDAHEFFLAIRVKLDEQFEKMAKRCLQSADALDISTLNPMKVFTLKTNKSFTCEKCGRSSKEEETETDILLRIGSTTRRNTVQDLIANLFSEKIQEQECQHCQQKGLNSERVSKFPQILVVTLLRYNENGVKDGCEVEVSTRLRIPEYCTKAVRRPESPVSNGNYLMGAEDRDTRSGYKFKPLRSSHLVEEVLNRVHTFGCENRKEHFEQFKNSNLSKNDTLISKPVVSDDGNSFYRSISWWLMAGEQDHDYFRERAFMFLVYNRHKMQLGYNKEEIENLVQEIKNSGSSTPIDITLMATMLNVDIYIFSENTWIRTQPEIISRYQSRSEEAIYLRFSNGYFEPVIRIKKEVEEEEMKKGRKRCSSESLDCGDEKRAKMEEGNATGYSLTSIIAHQGDTADSGHYVAYTKEQNDWNRSTWMYCSDTTISQISEIDMLYYTSTEGYILFYSKD